MREKSTVFFTEKISSEAISTLIKIILNSDDNIKLMPKIGIKISTGELGGKYYLSPNLVQPLVSELGADIVECNTAYNGYRHNTSDHIDTASIHGYSNVRILDTTGEIEIPVTNGKYIRKIIVGKDINNYSSLIVLSHFKGHAMAGFGGALKNLSIGFSSPRGKCLIHTGGKSETSWEGGNQEAFLASMADAARTLHEMYRNRIMYINVLNNISIDCDCSSNPTPPRIDDIGIMASTDPVALDKASLDRIMLAPGNATFINRVNERDGMKIFEMFQSFNKYGTIDYGNLDYSVVNIDSHQSIYKIYRQLI